MLLGDLLGQFRDESIAAETILRIGDIVLITKLREQASVNGQSLGVYATAAAQRYATDAPHEEWVTLMGALSGAKDPGAVYMQRAFAYLLKQNA